MGNKMKMGVGRAVEDQPTSERRKRSINLQTFSDDVIKTTKIGRGKR